MQAMADWANFAAQGQPLKLAINVPLATLQLPAFVDLIRSALPKKPDFPGLIVEVSEGDVLLDPGGIREIATQLQLYNVGISIDDFGGAHSSLSRLRELPCVELKLDRSYVSGCATDAAKQSVCAAAVELAQGFGLHSLRHGGGERRGPADLARARLPFGAGLPVRQADGLRELHQDAARPRRRAERASKPQAASLKRGRASGAQAGQNVLLTRSVSGHARFVWTHGGLHERRVLVNPFVCLRI